MKTIPSRNTSSDRMIISSSEVTYPGGRRQQDAGLASKSTVSILASVFKVDMHVLVLGVFQGHPPLLLSSGFLHLERENNFLKVVR